MYLHPHRGTDDGIEETYVLETVITLYTFHSYSILASGLALMRLMLCLSPIFSLEQRVYKLPLPRQFQYSLSSFCLSCRPPIVSAPYPFSFYHCNSSSGVLSQL
jgi:hypothetical protein